MNWTAIAAIYRFEMARFFRTLAQSFLSPVLSTSLYFVVFGTAIGSRIQEVEGVSYGAFIVPGLIMLSVVMLSISNASFGIYFPKFLGTIYELLSAPVTFIEIVIGYVGAAATKALFVGVVILITASFFVEIRVEHPLAMAAFLILTCLSFSLLGFIVGIWASNFEQISLIPAACCHAADLSGGHVLLDYDAAAAVADHHAVQSGGVPDFRVPLVVLWPGGCSDRVQPAGHSCVYRSVPGGDLVDLQNRLAHPKLGLGVRCIFAHRGHEIGSRRVLARRGPLFTG